MAAERRNGYARRAGALMFFLAALSMTASATDAAPNASDCSSAKLPAPFDFWVGSWEVYIDNKLAGTNHVEMLLGGCAYAEHWREADGSRGEGFFYYVPAQNTWKQVWVSDTPFVRGGVKEKTMASPPGRRPVIFHGTFAVSPADIYLDRTVLTPIDKDTVRQVVEISRDGGLTWKSAFDARYKRIAK